MSKNNIFIHIGGMRTGSTFLQQLFKEHPDVCLRLKSRFFSYNPYFEQGPSFFQADDSNRIIVDSDENYSLGRFKDELIHYSNENFNLKSELSIISHNQKKMAERLHATYEGAKILFVVREQLDWIKSIYKHDVEHFALDLSFEDFLVSELGQSYLKAGDYSSLFDTYSHLFGQENILVLFYEDLKLDKQSFLDSLYSFLDIGPYEYSGSNSKNVSLTNTQVYLLRWVNRLSQSKYGVKESRVFFTIRRWLIEKLPKINFFDNRLFKKKVEEQIQSQFSPLNRKITFLDEKESKLSQFGYITK